MNDRVNRLDNSVRGKGKKGGQTVEENSILAILECSDGKSFPVRSHVKGKLIEVNERLVKNPELILEKPFSDGYIAIVLPKIPEGVEELKKRLVTEENFEKLNR